MISFSEARSRILEQVNPISQMENIPVQKAAGRILAKSVVAAHAVPNHDNSGMDGYAVRFADLAKEIPTTLRVTADLPAGSRLERTVGPGEAIRIMTGAPIPDGCDCVVMQEVVTRQGAEVTIPPGQKIKQNVRPAGEDMQEGQEVMHPGRRLSPADVGLLTTLGFNEIIVYRRIKVGVLSTGNEVVEPPTPLLPGQVYDSNRMALLAALQSMGVETLNMGLVGDDRNAIAGALRRGAQECDAILTSGGVSVGDFDLVKEVLQDIGSIHFWKVAMKPGKPQAYGQLGQATFFGLPGNPVSSLAVFLLMVRPALFRLMGAEPQPEKRLMLPFRGTHHKKHDRMDFLRGVVYFQPEGAWVTLSGGQGSGILSGMANANALIALPESPLSIADGDLVPVWLIDYA
ncbi:MAG: molybdopterin molybdotransferase MoeA [Magnetococcales bacterium]|nr:molybdopterin molybdotransferase MoeA [Magnetococcales bacterium]NGZ26605.1 molybdopterin molybdotransferase MoeA [Magnetococcales bacterium]